MGKTLLPGFVAMWGLADLPIGHGEKEPFEAPALWSCDGVADLAWIAFSHWELGKGSKAGVVIGQGSGTLGFCPRVFACFLGLFSALAEPN